MVQRCIEWLASEKTQLTREQPWFMKETAPDLNLLLGSDQSLPENKIHDPAQRIVGKWLEYQEWSHVHCCPPTAVQLVFFFPQPAPENLMIIRSQV